MTETAPETLAASEAPTTPLDAANWFEIPTTDLERATRFYELLLNAQLRREVFGDPMSLFPSSVKGVGGALVHRGPHQPSACGTLIYLNCDSGLAAALERMEAGKRGEVVIPITPVPGGFGSYAVIRDSEGNHIGLHEH
jgi:predicted enzyme related to lactoylglutathione lyase